MTHVSGAALVVSLLAGTGTPRASLDVAAPVRVAGGQYRAITSPASEPAAAVEPFLLDRVPVTNEAFLAFVAVHSSWRRDRVSRLLADGGYLSTWSSAEAPGAGAPPRAPVVGVSWFAARAFCATRGGRLPSEAEWETAAAATTTRPDGRRDPAWRQMLLGWYMRPNPPVLPNVGLGSPNFWGARDLHGLVWEWVVDFGASIVSEKDGRLCGAGASRAIDPLDYPAFLRSAFRSSLQARTTTPNLGFRCAYPARGSR